MFTGIAARYDLMNRLMTAGQDVRWRKWVIQRAQLQRGQRLLDLGAGTGDLARAARAQCPSCFVLAADFTYEMMRVGKVKHGEPRLWCASDALALPFADEAFDALVSGFLLRNVVGLDAALREQLRVLKRGGRWVALDTTRPQKNFLTPAIEFHLRTIIPTLGKLITGHADAYTYLPTTTANFLSAPELAARVTQAGFAHVQFQRVMFGTIAIHWGIKVA
ncbi:MAG: ubiquinone/menaquinone biosynthesis methyltransferase [Chloroflexi bacterium]|nr:ubiquinone/menaquinone biosynthesis methyltransferase [Chloroflexota bacterium]